MSNWSLLSDDNPFFLIFIDFTCGRDLFFLLSFVLTSDSSLSFDDVPLVLFLLPVRITFTSQFCCFFFHVIADLSLSSNEHLLFFYFVTSRLDIWRIAFSHQTSPVSALISATSVIEMILTIVWNITTAVAVSVEVLVFIVIDRSSSKGCGFYSHYRSGSFHRDLILGL